MRSWYQAKMALEHASVISSDALHILVGSVLWLVTSAVVRRRLSGWMPWFAVLAAAILNEGVDLWVERWPDPLPQYAESAKDVVLTIIVPTVLMLAVRWRPNLFRSASRTR